MALILVLEGIPHKSVTLTGSGPQRAFHRMDKKTFSSPKSPSAVLQKYKLPIAWFSSCCWEQLRSFFLFTTFFPENNQF